MITLVILAVCIKIIWFDIALQCHRSNALLYIHPAQYPWWYLGKTHYGSKK